MANAPLRKDFVQNIFIPETKREALEAEIAPFLKQDGLRVDKFVPVYGLGKIIEEHPELKELIFHHAKDATIDAVLSSLITQEPHFFESEWHDFLGTSLKENLTTENLQNIPVEIKYRPQDKAPYPRKIRQETRE